MNFQHVDSIETCWQALHDDRPDLTIGFVREIIGNVDRPERSFSFEELAMAVAAATHDVDLGKLVTRRVGQLNLSAEERDRFEIRTALFAMGTPFTWDVAPDFYCGATHSTDPTLIGMKHLIRGFLATRMRMAEGTHADFSGAYLAIEAAYDVAATLQRDNNAYHLEFNGTNVALWHGILLNILNLFPNAVQVLSWIDLKMLSRERQNTHGRALTEAMELWRNKARRLASSISRA